MIEGLPYAELGMVLPIVLITLQQVRAILKRDGNQCMMPDEHICRGKLSVHHIEGKEDASHNLIPICRKSHWEIVHNGANKEQQLILAKKFKKIAVEQTDKARKGGWEFE